MSGTIDEVESGHLGARAITHPVRGARGLISAPIAFSSDVLRRHIYGTTRKRLHLGEGFRIGTPADAIPLQRASEPRPAVFGDVDSNFGFSQPFAVRDVVRRRHEW